MPEAQTAESNDARQASMSRVQTQETVFAKLVSPEAAKVPTEVKTTDETNKDEGVSTTKKSASERIQELASKRREAEAKADAAEREAADLRAKLQALTAQAKPMEADVRPLRSAFATEDEYIDAVASWGARKEIAKREQAAIEARFEAEQAEIASQWSKRQDKAMKELPDYADVISKSDVSVPNHVHQAILESDYGPQIAYFLALPDNADEVKKLREMKPLAAVKRIATLERELSEIGAEKAEEVKETPPPKKSKAPPPIEPVKSAPSSSSGSASNYDEYKRRRQAEKS